MLHSNQVVVLQIDLQDGVPHRGEHELDVVGVGGAGEVRVHRLVGLPVQLEKLVEDI